MSTRSELTRQAYNMLLGQARPDRARLAQGTLRKVMGMGTTVRRDSDFNFPRLQQQ